MPGSMLVFPPLPLHTPPSCWLLGRSFSAPGNIVQRSFKGLLPQASVRFGHQQQKQQEQPVSLPFSPPSPSLSLSLVRLQQAATAKMDDVSAGIDDAEQMAANKMATASATAPQPTRRMSDANVYTAQRACHM